MMPATRPPFQGDSLGDVFPGLKPWAVLFSPFGRRGNVQTRPNGSAVPLVLEVHSKDGFYVQGLYSRTGKLDPSNSTLIDWSPPVKNGGSDRIQYPALAATGRYAYQTHGNPLGTGPKIYYSGAEIYCPDL
jgi:hypothetical protein